MVAAQNRDMHRLRNQADGMDYMLRGYRESDEYRRGLEDGKLNRQPLAVPQEYAQITPELDFRGWAN